MFTWVSRHRFLMPYFNNAVDEGAKFTGTPAGRTTFLAQKILSSSFLSQENVATTIFFSPEKVLASHFFHSRKSQPNPFFLKKSPIGIFI